MLTSSGFASFIGGMFFSRSSKMIANHPKVSNFLRLFLTAGSSRTYIATNMYVFPNLILVGMEWSGYWNRVQE